MEGMEGKERGEKTREVIIVSEEVFTIGRRFSIIDEVLAVVIHHPDITQTPPRHHRHPPPSPDRQYWKAVGDKAAAEQCNTVSGCSLRDLGCCLGVIVSKK